MHKIPQKTSTQASAHHPQSQVPSDNFTSKTHIPEPLFNATVNSNLSSMLQGLNTNTNLSAPSKSIQKENLNNANFLLQTQQLYSLNGLLGSGTQVAYPPQSQTAERRASEHISSANNSQTLSSQGAGGGGGANSANYNRINGVNSKESRQFLPSKKIKVAGGSSQKVEALNFNNPSAISQYGSQAKGRIEKSRRNDKNSIEGNSLYPNALGQKTTKTFQNKSGSPGQKLIAAQRQQIANGGESAFDCLGSASNQSSAINSKQGTQFINKKVLQSANQIIHQLHAQEQALRNNIHALKGKKQIESKAKAKKDSDQQYTYTQEGLTSVQQQLAVSSHSDSLQPHTNLTQYTQLNTQLQQTESSDNNTQVTVIQVVEGDVYANEYLQQQISSNNASSQQNTRKSLQAAGERKKKTPTIKRSEEKGSTLNRSSGNNPQANLSRGNSGNRNGTSASLIRQAPTQITALHYTAGQQAKVISASNSKLKNSQSSQQQRRSKLRLDQNNEQRNHVQQPAVWIQKQFKNQRLDLNQSQVIKVKSPLIKEGGEEDLSEMEDAAQGQQQHGVQVQEFEDEDDDYQFSSQVKKSNNTVLNSDESSKYAGAQRMKQPYQIQAFELAAFEASDEQTSQKGGKHNFYMTQVIKQPVKNANSSAEAYNPLNMTQSSQKSAHKLSSGVNNSSLRQSNIKISKSQLKTYNSRKPTSSNQHSSYGAPQT